MKLEKNKIRKHGALILTLIGLKIGIPNKPYIELNHLKIIKEIEIIECEKITITYKEIIPKKDENSIKYEYKAYKETGNNIKEVINKLEKNKNIYKEKATIKHKTCNKKRG